ncbi:MAG TPA: preprotein translocase subunit YajC [Fibrobacteraceae bacterium]|nr:preprotein translocase subunit YajC [Fibrobacteraceae bacterium]
MQNLLQSPLFPMVLMFVVLYFFFLRPKQKEMQKAEQMRKNLKKGDKVVTVSGLFATVHQVNDHSVVLKAEENVKLEYEKSAVARVLVDKVEEKK